MHPSIQLDSDMFSNRFTIITIVFGVFFMCFDVFSMGFQRFGDFLGRALRPPTPLSGPPPLIFMIFMILAK